MTPTWRKMGAMKRQDSAVSSFEIVERTIRNSVREASMATKALDSAGGSAFCQPTSIATLTSYPCISVQSPEERSSRASYTC